MALQASIPLTSKLQVENGSHILYFYTDPLKYIDNAVAFILKGIELGHPVIMIETDELFALMKAKLQLQVGEDEQRAWVHFVNRTEFYEMHEEFQYERVLSKLDPMIQPYLEKGTEVRLWGHIGWRQQPSMMEKVRQYEEACDLTLNELGFVTVCAYDANVVTASIQLAGMESHPYLMTDDALVLSTLYKHNHHHAPSSVFPALSSQVELESEMDLYKQKLDFVHVVSHEVRNPLTVIRAYASLLMHRVHTPEDREKLKQINDYVMLIDNEISHIINTEQMLSTEALWRRKLIVPKELVLEVMEMMEVKARVQNIQLNYEVLLHGRETLLGNATGFKLIISNILSNAIKYSEEGRTVNYKVYCGQGHLVMETVDDGVGMTEDQLSRLFQKYEKTNDQRSGQGIGLFMVKQLVDHHMGDIHVWSQPGVGTRVTVRLPLMKGAV